MFDGDVALGVELDDCDSRSAVRLMFLGFTLCGRDAKTELAIEHGRRNDGRMRAAFWRDADRDTGVIPLQ